MSKTSQTEQVQQIDPDIRSESEQLYALGHMISGMGYNPYKGVDIAARSPKELAADEAANLAAGAFNMPMAAPSNLPTPIEQDGMLGYSTQKMAQDDKQYQRLKKQVDAIFNRGANQPELTGGIQPGGGGKK